MRNPLIRRIAVAMALFALLTSRLPAEPFPDVPLTHWAYDAVEYLASKGLVVGYPDGEFKGDRMLTRYEYAMIIARLERELTGEMRSIVREELASVGLGPQLQALLDQLRADFQRELDDVRAQLKSHEGRITALEKQTGSLAERTSNLEGQVAAHERDIQALKRIKWSGFGRFGMIKADGEEFRPASSQPLQYEQSDFDFAFGLNLFVPINDVIVFNTRLSTLGPTGTLFYGDVNVNGNVFNAISYGGYDPFRTGDYRVPTNNNAFSNQSFDLNNAYLVWTTPHGSFDFSVFAGKFNPMWKTTYLFFNPAIGYEGVGANVTYKQKWTFTFADLRTENRQMVNGSGGLRPVLPTLDDTDFVYFQFYNPGTWVRNLELTVGYLGTNETDENLVIADAPQVWLASGAYNFPHRRPFKAYLAWANNGETLRTTTAADFGADEFTTSLMAGVKYGDTARVKSWLLDINWKQTALNSGLPSYFVRDAKFLTASFYYRYEKDTIMSLTLDTGSVGSKGSLNSNPSITSITAGLSAEF
ncbi:MAG: S-layer homology domain-containing protein [bacterium JZ-2024 1]